MKKISKKILTLWEYFKEEFLMSGTVGKNYNLALLKKFTNSYTNQQHGFYFDRDYYMDEIGLLRISEILRFINNEQFTQTFYSFLEKELNEKPEYINFIKSLHKPNQLIIKNFEPLLLHSENLSSQNLALIASHISDQAFIFKDVGLLCEMFSIINNNKHSMPVLNVYTFGLILVLKNNMNLLELKRTLSAMFPYTIDWIEKTCEFLAEHTLRATNKVLLVK